MRALAGREAFMRRLTEIDAADIEDGIEAGASRGTCCRTHAWQEVFCDGR